MDVVKMLKAFFELASAIINGGFLKLTNKIHLIYSLLDDVVFDIKLGVSRAVILRIHNGGGNLSSSKPTYASVVYEVHRPPLHSIRAETQNIPADRTFMAMLQDVKLNGFVTLDVRSLPDGWLKSFYTIQGIKRAKLFLVKEKRGGFLGLDTKELQILSISTVSSHITLDEDALSVDLIKLVSDIKRNL